MIKYVSILVTVLIGLIGLLTETNKTSKIMLAILIIIGGCFTAYQAYRDNESQKEKDNRLKNLLLSSSPSFKQIDQFNPILASFLKIKIGTSNFSFFNRPGATGFDIKNNKEEIIGYLFLLDDEFMDILSSEKKEKMLEVYFAKPKETQFIEKLWNEITNEVTGLVSFYATTIGIDRTQYYLDSDLYEIRFKPNGFDNYPELIFQRNDLEEIIQMSKIERGAFIINKCKYVWP